jgi:hypothetical protein
MEEYYINNILTHKICDFVQYDDFRVKRLLVKVIHQVYLAWAMTCHIRYMLCFI